MIASIVIFAVLLFGSAEDWAFSLVGLLAAACFGYFLSRHPEGLVRAGQRLFPDKLAIVSASGFFILLVFQLVPLPPGLLHAASPEKAVLLSRMGLAGPDTVTFSFFSGMNSVARGSVYLIVFLISASLEDTAEAKRVFLMLVAFGFVLSVFAIIQKGSWNGKIYWIRKMDGVPFGPFPNRNHFAGFVGMLIPLGLALSFEAKRREMVFMSALFSLVMSFALIHTLSRGAFVSSLSSLALFFILVYRSRLKRGGTMYAIFILVLAAGSFFYLGISPVLERFAEDGITDRLRFHIWEVSLAIFRDFPVFGTGLGAFGYVFPLYNDSIRMPYFFAHNDYLQLLVETGAAGFLLAGLFFLSLGRNILRHLSRGGTSPLMAGLLASIFYISIHSVVDYNLHVPSNAILLSSILGMASAFRKEG